MTWRPPRALVIRGQCVLTAGVWKRPVKIMKAGRISITKA